MGIIGGEQGHSLGEVLVLIVLLWPIVSYLMALMNGWRSLSEIYSANNFSGRIWKGQTTGGSLSGRGMITIGADKDSLFLDVMILFKIGHPSLKIPWSDIDVTKSESNYTLNFWKKPGRNIVINNDIGKKLKEVAGNNWREVAV